MSKKLFHLQVIQPFRAPKNDNGEITYKSFKENEQITAYETDISSLPDSHAQGFTTSDGYFIPKTNVYVMGIADEKPTPIQQEVENTQVEESAKPKTNTEPAKKMVDSLKTSNQTAIRGAMVGAGAGLLYSMVKSKNKFVWIAIGGLAGYTIGNMIAKSKAEKDK